MTARHKMLTTKPTTDRVALLRFQAQMADMSRKVGARIRELREERRVKDPRWTQDYLARQVEEHMSGTQMSRYERGENMPGEKRLARIAEILETDVADLYAGPMDEREENTADLSESLSEAEPGSSKIEEMLQEVLNQQAVLLADVSEVRSVQEHLSPLIERLGRVREDTGS
jgi:transcriptional regulator with XRE-family HTH domain